MEDNNFDAWVAGFWEGEGCICKLKSGVGYIISISQAIDKDRDVELIMGRIQKTYGGYIQKTFFENKSYKSMLQWRISKREDVIKFINIIYPYCQLRKKQLKDTLLHYENNPRRGYNDFKIAQKLKQEGKKVKEIAKILGRKDIWRLLNRTFYAKYANLY